MGQTKRWFPALVFSLLASTGVRAETITVSLGEWPPYASEHIASDGIAPLIVKEAFDLEGITVNWLFLPWQRAYLNAARGDVDATILWIETEERSRDFLFGDVIISGKAVFFYRKDMDFHWKDVEDLQGYRIGGLISATYPWVERAKERGVDLKLDLVADEILNFKKLAHDRLDLYSQDYLVGRYLMENGLNPQERANIAFDPTVLEQWDYRIMFPKTGEKSQKLLSIFNSGLARLRESGRYDEIIATYSATPR